MEKIKFVMTDTDTQVSAVCRRALEAKGIAVTVCEKNGTKALETLLAVHPQAVLLDAFMPDIECKHKHQNKDQVAQICECVDNTIAQKIT